MDVFNYALVKYCPNKATGEFVVVGIIVEDVREKATLVSVHESLRHYAKLRAMFGDEHGEIYNSLARGFVSEMVRYATLWKHDKIGKMDSTLQRYAEPTNDPMRLGNISAIMAKDILNAATDIRERHDL